MKIYDSTGKSREVSLEDWKKDYLAQIAAHKRGAVPASRFQARAAETKQKKPTAKQVKQVAGYMRAIAEAFKAYLQKKLSVPVSIIRRRNTKTGRWATHIVRSNPGEYPRSETGSLASTVSYSVSVTGTKVNVSIGWLGDRSQKRFMSKTRNYPVGHPKSPKGGRKFKLYKGVATKSSPKTPDYYSFILEYRMQRRLLQKAWKDFVTSGMLRRAVGAAGFTYVPGLGTYHMITFGEGEKSGSVAMGFKTWSEQQMNIKKYKSGDDASWDSLFMPGSGRPRFNVHSREKWMDNVEGDKKFGPGYIGGPPRAEDY